MPQNLTSLSEFSEKLSINEFFCIEFWTFRSQKSRLIAPLISKLAAEKKGICSVFKVNVDLAPELTSMLKVYSVPSIVLYQNGSPIEKFDETVKFDDILKILDKVN